MCANTPHAVPPYNAVNAKMMHGWIETKVLHRDLDQSECYSFKGQPLSMSGQRLTLFPFMKFFLSGSSEIQDEQGNTVRHSRVGDLAIFTDRTWANVQFVGPVSFFRVTILPEETFFAFTEIIKIQPGDTGPREEQVHAYILQEPPTRLIRELWDRLNHWPSHAERTAVWQLMLRDWCASLKRESLNANDSKQYRLRMRRSEVLNYLEANAHRLINRQSVAKALAMSEGELSRLFQRTGDESFTQSLNRIRLEHAKNWLRLGNMSVADVAARCGFTSANYFAQVFRRFEGVSPLTWKAQKR